MLFRSLACILTFLAMAVAAQAQFSGSIKTLKRNHIVGEPVIVRITLTNFTGREQILHGNRMPWISFMVKNSNGNPVIARGAPAPGPIRIEAGQTLARDFNLSQQFQLNDPGNYSVSAVIRPNDESIEGTTTQRALFQLTEGRPYWSRKVGNVGPRGSTHEYRILQFRSDKAAQFYVQIKETQTGRTLRTASLGNVLMMRKPTITIDGQRHLHVLFLTTPNTYLHYQISPMGELVNRAMHRHASRGEPALTTTREGAVIVTNSVLYDPVAEAKKRAEIKKITDRP